MGRNAWRLPPADAELPSAWDVESLLKFSVVSANFAVMKRRPAVDVGTLGRKAARLDAQHVNELYGLEPVYEPGAGVQGNVDYAHFVTIPCPYCGEGYQTQLDLSAGSFTYIEDCHVCCQPIELKVTADEQGGLAEVVATRLD